MYSEQLSIYQVWNPHTEIYSDVSSTSQYEDFIPRYTELSRWSGFQMSGQQAQRPSATRRLLQSWQQTLRVATGNSVNQVQTWGKPITNLNFKLEQWQTRTLCKPSAHYIGQPQAVIVIRQSAWRGGAAAIKDQCTSSAHPLRSESPGRRRGSKVGPGLTTLGEFYSCLTMHIDVQRSR